MSQFIKIIKELKRELKYSFIDKKTHLIQIKKYKSIKNLKLNLGCGSKIKKGFINIDFNKAADLRLDLRKPLPFKNNSVDYIYSEHFFEHLSYLDTTAIRCLLDYKRVLKKGSKMRMVLPDMEKALKAYIEKDYEYFKTIKIEDKIPQSKKYSTIIDYINYGAYQHGEHKYCYDFEKIYMLLKSVGFKEIIKDSFNPKIDQEGRKRFSLYVEAKK